MRINLRLNGSATEVSFVAGTPLLWVLRDVLNLTGTKFGCGIGECGACTVHVDGKATKSCSIPAESAAGTEVTTIEGLGDNQPNGVHPVQSAWLEECVPQCGFCQSGQLMAAASLLGRIPKPTDKDIDETMSAVLCRCGTYQRIRAAIHRAANQ
ncbi:MAG: isoquinoline 1-oxidoreductase alpha subunit [Hyphomicrobiaceae bacterium]|jgi:isoquinoline 1-oxidoreductase alpha subunit